MGDCDVGWRGVVAVAEGIMVQECTCAMGMKRAAEGKRGGSDNEEVMKGTADCMRVRVTWLITLLAQIATSSCTHHKNKLAESSQSSLT